MHNELTPEQKAEVDRRVKEHFENKKKLKLEDDKIHFSYDLESTLTEEERRAGEVMAHLKEQFKNPMYDATIHNFYAVKDELMKSKLYDILNKMPKGGLHHIHTTAAVPLDSYFECTKDDATYFSQRDDLFKVYPNPDLPVDEGFIRCNDLRKWSESVEEFDRYIQDQILLRRDQTENLESHDIWKFF
jgi:hypothetical protein